MPIAAYSDEHELLCLFKTGDQKTFTVFYDRYSASLFQRLLQLVGVQSIAEELLQEIFVTLWEKRETITIEQNFAAYLHRIAANKAIDFFRRLKRDRLLYRRVLQTSAALYSHVEEQVVSAETATIFQAAIDKLSPQRRQVFRLCKMEGRSYQEVSHLLGISTSTINDHIVKATRLLRDYLGTNKELAGIASLLVFMSPL